MTIRYGFLGLLGVIFLSVGLAEETPPPNSIAGAIKQLGDESFEKREQADAFLLFQGKKSLPALLQARRSDDPEIKHRAESLFLELQSGITRETPPEVVALVKTYIHSANPIEKINIYSKLYSVNAFKQTLYLHENELTPRVKKHTQRLFNKSVKTFSKHHLEAGTATHALQVLAHLTPNEIVEQTWSTLLHLSGEKLPADAPLELKLAYARQVGNIPLVRKLATKSKNKDALNRLALLEGNPFPMLGTLTPNLVYYSQNINRGRESKEELEVLVDQCKEIAALRWEGRETEARKIAKNRLQLLQEDEPWNAKACVLLLNGYSSEVIPRYIQNPNNLRRIWNLHLRNGQIHEALELLNITAGKELESEWVQTRLASIALGKKQFLAKLLNKGGTKAPVRTYESLWEELFSLTSFLVSYGEVEKARILLKKMWAISVKEKRQLKFYKLLIRARASIPSVFLESLAEADQKDPTVLKKFLQNIFDSFPDNSLLKGLKPIRSFMFETILQTDEKTTPLEAAKIALRLTLPTSYNLKSTQIPASILHKWENILVEAFKEKGSAKDLTLEKFLSQMKTFAQLRNDLSSEERFSKELIKLGKPITKQYRLIEIALLKRDWETAKTALEEFLITHPNDSRTFITLTTLAGCDIHLGNAEKATERLQQAEKMVFVDTERFQQAEKAVFGDTAMWCYMGEILRKMGCLDEAQSYFQRVILSEKTSSQIWSAALLNLSTLALEKNDCTLGASCNEVMCLIFAEEAQFSFRAVLQFRFRATFCRGMQLFEEGDKERAFVLLNRARNMPMVEDDIANFFYPAILKIYPKSTRLKWLNEKLEPLKKNLPHYPKSAELHNSMAWLAARAGERLEEAETWVTTALKQAPEEAAYLDTLAEIWFARGNREKAIEYSNRALEIRQGDPMIRDQNIRFKTAPLPSH